MNGDQIASATTLSRDLRNALVLVKREGRGLPPNLGHAEPGMPRPRVMASLRSTAIGLHGIADGATNIAAALRHHAMHPAKAIQLLSRPLTTLT